MLFSNVMRTDTRPKLYGEALFPYLDKSGRAFAASVRQLLEEWVAHYPDSEKEEFKRRLCTNKNMNFLSACFELYLHELLRRLGYKLSVHPVTNSSRRLDFLACSPSGNDFYMESVLASDTSKEEAAQEARMNAVYDEIDKLDSPDFFIRMEIDGAPDTQPPGSKIRSKLAAWLGNLNYSEMVELYKKDGINAMPRMPFRYESWAIDFFPIPKTPAARGKPGVRPIGVHMPAHCQAVHTEEVIRNSLVEKRPAEYGDLDKPYVIAVDALVMSYDFEEVAMDALFGDPQWALPQTLGGTTFIPMPRKRNGFWWGLSGGQNTRVSAVLLTNLGDPTRVATEDICLFHNPWAARPLLGEIRQLSEAIPEGDRMRFKEGKHPREIFNLPDGWLGE